MSLFSEIGVGIKNGPYWEKLKKTIDPYYFEKVILILLKNGDTEIL